MKLRNRLTALLTGTALLGGMLTAVPVTAAETPADSVRSCTLDALMAMDEAQINALPDFSYYAVASDYAEAVKETENFHEGELKLGKERFFVKLTDPALADYLYLYAVVADDSSGEMLDYPVLSWAEAENLLGIPAAYMEDVTEGESRGYLYVTVDLTAYGQENACKTYILTEAKLRANENIADVYGTGLGGGKPVSDERTVVIPAETDTTAAAQDGKTVFLERIAGWQNAALSDCVILGEDTLLTPDKPYQISRVRFTPYSVSLRSSGTIDPETVKARWKEMLLAAGYPENAGMWDYYTCEITETDGGYQIKVPQDAYAGITLADCLMTFPDVQRIQAQFGYLTNDRPNQPSGFAFRFTVDGTEMPQPEDFPALSGVQIAGDVPLPAQQTKSTWFLTLESGKYEDYFAAAKYLQTLSFVHDLKLGYVSTELADDSDDARILDPAPTVLYDRGDLNQDGSADVGDAVLLARYLSADTEAVVYDQGLKNADVDGNGSIRDDDITALLKRIAKQF